MSATSPDPAATRAESGKYLTFLLGREHYGISAHQVREIIRLCEITPVPRMPPHIRGVINLRGKIVPVVDLHLKFSLPPAEQNDRACIIVVEVRSHGGAAQLMSVIVDTVDDVVQLTGRDIEPPPEFGAAFDSEYLLGIAKIKDVMKTLLDIDRVIDAEHLTAFG